MILMKMYTRCKVNNMVVVKTHLSSIRAITAMDKNSNPMVSIEREDSIRLHKLWEFQTYNKIEEAVVGHTNVEVLIQEIVITEIS